MKLVLKEKLNQTSDVVSFLFEKPQDFNWQPGQYLQYLLPHQNPDNRGIKRYFSIASTPEEGVINLTTRLNKERSSSFKEALFAMTPGMEIETGDLEGDFVVSDEGKSLVFIAGGIGITPFRAILKDLIGKTLQVNITLIYASRNNEIVFKEELDELASLNPGFKITYLVEPQTIDETTIKGLIPNLNESYFYISGPAPMVFAMEEMIKGMGVREERIKLDDFPGYEWPGVK